MRNNRLTKDLIEPGDIGDGLIDNLVLLLIIHPKWLIVEFYTANVGIWPE